MYYFPVRIEDDIPYYNLSDINVYGFPEIYGIVVYRVIDTGYDLDDNIYSDHHYCKPVHKYIREERFTMILKYMLGGGHIPKSILDDLCCDTNPDECWKSIKKQLKQKGFS
jgi:hypothetical protein